MLSTVVATGLPLPAPPCDVIRTLKKLEDDLARGVLSLDEAITALADANRGGALAALIATRVGLGQAVVLGVLDAEPEEPAALLCRAAGISLNGYSAILRMRRRKQNAATMPPTALLSGYRNLPKIEARELAALLQTDPAADEPEAAPRNASADRALP